MNAPMLRSEYGRRTGCTTPTTFIRRFLVVDRSEIVAIERRLIARDAEYQAAFSGFPFSFITRRS
ncbi:hypothetical protein K8I61_13030 [bacterium]|nr:hypothetical protein [bacterium]